MAEVHNADWYSRRKVEERKDDKKAHDIKQVKVGTVIQVKPHYNGAHNWKGVLAIVVDLEDKGVKAMNVAPDAGKPVVLTTFLPFNAFLIIGQAKWMPRP